MLTSHALLYRGPGDLNSGSHACGSGLRLTQQVSYPQSHLSSPVKRSSFIENRLPTCGTQINDDSKGLCLRPYVNDRGIQGRGENSHIVHAPLTLG